jgi:hypothetical protein
MMDNARHQARPHARLSVVHRHRPDLGVVDSATVEDEQSNMPVETAWPCRTQGILGPLKSTFWTQAWMCQWPGSGLWNLMTRRCACCGWKCLVARPGTPAGACSGSHCRMHCTAACGPAASTAERALTAERLQEPIMRKPTDGSALDASFRNFAGRTPFCQLLGSQDPNHPDLQVLCACIFLVAVLQLCAWRGP